jgi:importin subunit beta-1
MGQPPERSSKKYAKGALQHLVPLLLETLSKQVQYSHDNKLQYMASVGYMH